MERSEIPRYVPDASVAVKWFIEERDTPLALRMKQLYEKGEIDLDAPSLINYEVASALRFHPKVSVTMKQFRIVREALQDMQIAREPNDSEWMTAFRLSVENSVSIHDAVYLGFAVSGQCQLVTADETILGKLRSPRVKDRIIMLRNVTL